MGSSSVDVAIDMAKIELKNVIKSFGNVIAINNISIEIYDREFLVMLGPSGCGKTTTLRAIAGLEDVDAGNILIDENSVNHLSPADRNISFVFQFYALYPHLTVFDNIAFPLKASKVEKTEIERRVLEVAKTLQIDTSLNRKPKQLSGGEMQRVALGRAMVRRPKAFLMDEPMSNLDAKLRIQMRSELKRLQKKVETTTVFVTHDQIEAMSMADRIAVMHQGEIQQIDPPKKIYNQPKNLFVAQFMGSPAMNLIEGVLESKNSKLVLSLLHTECSFILSDAMAQKMMSQHKLGKIIFGIRPEHVTLSKTPMGYQFETKVHLVEYLGATKIIDVMLGENNHTRTPIFLKSRVHSSFQVFVGESVWINFEEQVIHIFDQESQIAIS